MSRLPTDTDLSHLFGIDVDAFDAAAQPARLHCSKCQGSGKFRGRNGKVYGGCFACNGSGLEHVVPIAKPGDCDKCAGSGEWRPGRPCFACNGTGKVKVDVAVDISAIAEAFATAHSKGAKTPTLRLGSFIFSRAPDHGKNAGAIYVKREADHEYLGKVAGGVFRPTMSCDAVTQAEVAKVAASPADAAIAYGQLTKRCSVCGITLTNPESKARGIGPICAEKFGW